jgi:hypothetical protein
MTALRKGDLVRFAYYEPGKTHRRVLVGIVVEMLGDFNVRLYCDGNETAQPFAAHCHTIGARDAEGRQVLTDEQRLVWLRLMAAWKSTAGKAAVRRSRRKADSVLVERDGKEVTLSERGRSWYGTTPEGGELPPGKGRGATDTRLVPMRLASKSNPKDWHPEFESYLGYWVDDALGDALAWLADHQPLLFETFYDRTERRLSRKEMAEKHGVKEETVKDRLARARKLLKMRIATPELLEERKGRAA